jgi:hypothetical protein
MPATVQVVHKWATVPNQGQPGVQVIDTTSSSNDWRRDLSPFFLGPCQLYGGYTAQNMENAWQYAKVYTQHIQNGEPTKDYWKWATKGWADPTARRYPMGRGAIPEYSLWDGQKLGYIEARKIIYGPLYAEAVQQTAGWQQLVHLYNTSQELYLRDWDGWSMSKHGMSSLSDVLNNSRRKMGHAFVLKMLLENDAALQEMQLRV